MKPDPGAPTDPAGGPPVTQSFAPPETAPGGEDGLAIVAAETYERLGELGRGGMGRITVARDRRLGREVALKEPAHDDAVGGARFAREATITARLQHPGIIPIYEAGRWPTGEPFYAMKRVEGRTLHETIAGASTLRDRLGLLRHVIATTEALAYAHRRGIVHRDLKPANVLIGDLGETVVIDWGLAKDLGGEQSEPASAAAAGGQGGLAGVGRAIGTPAYMPPEQARGGAADRRSDVYALGALLYHVLSGRPPYRGPLEGSALDAVLAGPPRALAAIVPEVPADLAAIVGKAMARDPGDRYPSAAELAADLIRFETGQLVAAHAYSGAALVRRWLRRHRAAVAVAAALLAALAVTAVVSIRRVLRERRRADASATLARAQRGAAEQLVEYVLHDLRDRLEKLGRLDLLSGVAERVDAYYRELGAVDDVARRRRAVAALLFGDVARDRGAIAEAEGSYLAACAALAELAAGASEDALSWRGLADCKVQLAALRIDQGRADEAPGLYGEAIAIYEAQAVADPAAARSLASARAGLAHWLLQRGRYEPAEAERRAILALRGELAAAPTALSEDHRALGHAHGDLGFVIFVRGDLSAALVEYQLGLAILDVYAVGHAFDARLDEARAHFRRQAGFAALRQGDTAGALGHLTAGIALGEALVRHEPDHVRQRAGLAEGYAFAAETHMVRREYAAARAAIARAVELGEALLASDPDNVGRQNDVAAARRLAGDIAMSEGKGDEALRWYRGCVEIHERLARAEPDNTWWQINLAADHLAAAEPQRRAGRTAEAVTSARRGVDLLEALAAAAPDDPGSVADLGRAHGMLGRCLADHGDRAGALAAWRRQVELHERAVAHSPDNGAFQRYLAASSAELANALPPGPAATALRQRAIALLTPLRAAGHLDPEALALLTRLERREGN